MAGRLGFGTFWAWRLGYLGLAWWDMDPHALVPTPANTFAPPGHQQALILLIQLLILLILSKHFSR
jgi:hypothetical protein